MHKQSFVIKNVEWNNECLYGLFWWDFQFTYGLVTRGGSSLL